MIWFQRKQGRTISITIYIINVFTAGSFRLSLKGLNLGFSSETDFTHRRRDIWHPPFQTSVLIKGLNSECRQRKGQGHVVCRHLSLPTKSIKCPCQLESRSFLWRHVEGEPLLSFSVSVVVSKSSWRSNSGALTFRRSATWASKSMFKKGFVGGIK
jgi:hypothetical protein